MKDETHFSAEQSGAQAPPWISFAHGDQSWPHHYQPAPRPGPQTPVGLNLDDHSISGAASSASGPVVLSGLNKRADFLATARERRAFKAAFTLQARCREPDKEPGVARIGFTCSKKVGNAVARNRAKRRLRAAARLVMSKSGKPGWDYVLIGRHTATATRDFRKMCDELDAAIQAIHARNRSN
jgi:ribonuclease P protein component